MADDSCVINKGNFRELLRFRVNVGDKALEDHLKAASSRATYISKTVQNEIIECCGSVILDIIVQRVRNSRYFSILFDETTDLSHTSQLSLTVRYVHEGAVYEDFLEFVDPHAEVYGRDDDEKDVDNVSSSSEYSHDNAMTMAEGPLEHDSIVKDAAPAMQEPKLTGSVLGNLVVQRIEKLGLHKDHCIGIGTDGCSVMASTVCGAVSIIQKVAPQATRYPCFNHALNLSLSKSSTVQAVRNAVGTMKEVVAFFTGSGKRNFVLKHNVGRQLQSLCETRWV